jgi:hypothetical protein
MENEVKEEMISKISQSIAPTNISIKCKFRGFAQRLRLKVGM